MGGARDFSEYGVSNWLCDRDSDVVRFEIQVDKVYDMVDRLNSEFVQVFK